MATDRGQSPAQAQEPNLGQFAARLVALHRRRVAVAAGMQALLWSGLPLLVLVAGWPAAWPWGAVGFLGSGGLAAGLAWVRCVPPAPVVAGSLRGSAGAFGDELVAWLEGGAEPEPLRPWLGRELTGQLPALPAAALRSVGARPLGRLRWLLFAVVALWLAWLCLRWWQPPWAGVLGGRPEPPPPPALLPTPEPGVPEDGTQQGAAGVGGAVPPPAPGGLQPPAPAEDPDAGAGPAEPPAPLLDLPGARHFVVPDHIADGPTTRARMHAAEAPTPEAAGAPPPAGAAAGSAPAPQLPPPSAETFVRAAEAAAAARHVPAAERPLVRRYFTLLQEAAR